MSVEMKTLTINGTTFEVVDDQARVDINQLNDDKVNKPTESPNGISGQLLRTNGDGTTQWADEGLPTDEQTATAVSKWLDEHPAATTTVQDGTITEPKIHTDFLPYIKKDYVTPEMFGAVGDGETDDSGPIQEAIDSGCPIYFSSKTYAIAKPIVFTNYCDCSLNCNTIIKAIAKMDYVICFYGTSSGAFRTSIFYGGIIDGNNLAMSSITCDGAGILFIKRTRVHGFTKYGIYCTGHQNDKGNVIKTNGLRLSDIYVYNTLANADTYGIYENTTTYCTDNKYDHIVMRDCCIGAHIFDARIEEFHPWMYDPNLIPGSCAIEVCGGGGSVSQFFMDTYQYGIKINSSCSFTVSNMRQYDNQTAYTSELLSSYPHTLFLLENGNNCRIAVTNLIVNLIKADMTFMSQANPSLAVFNNLLINNDNGFSIANFPVTDKTRYYWQRSDQQSWSLSTADTVGTVKVNKAFEFSDRVVSAMVDFTNLTSYSSYLEPWVSMGSKSGVNVRAIVIAVPTASITVQFTVRALLMREGSYTLTETISA